MNDFELEDGLISMAENGNPYAAWALKTIRLLSSDPTRTRELNHRAQQSERNADRLRAEGATKERALAVAYIREHGGECLGGHPVCIQTIFEDAARGLERGEHVPSAKEGERMRRVYVDMGKNSRWQRKRFVIKVDGEYVSMTVETLLHGEWESYPDEGTGFKLSFAKDIIAALTMATSEAGP